MNAADSPVGSVWLVPNGPLVASAADLLIQVPSVNPGHDNIYVRNLFSGNLALSSVPVIERENPVGLIMRDAFLGQMARPFATEVYGRRSCTAFMDPAPLLVDQATTISDLSALAIEIGEKVLKGGFIVTDGGNYVGYGSGFDLLRALSDLEIEKHRMLMDSINYASVIQRSFLSSSRQQLEAALDEHFLIWEPRDVVGGDCYFFQRRERGFFAAVIDCTGHGVPGAFMTLIAASSLGQALRSTAPSDPAAVMGELNKLIKLALHQDKTGDDDRRNDSDDGLDAAFVWFDAPARHLIFAGAKIPLIIADSNGVRVIEGNRRGAGYADTDFNYSWTNRLVSLSEDTAVYIATDGIFDQIGGNKRIALGKNRLSKFLEQSAALSMPLQRAAVLHFLAEYQGSEDRRDDVTVLGFKVTEKLAVRFGGVN